MIIFLKKLIGFYPLPPKKNQKTYQYVILMNTMNTIINFVTSMYTCNFINHGQLFVTFYDKERILHLDLPFFY